MCCVDRLNPQAKAAGQKRSTLTPFLRSDLGYYTFMVPKHGPFRERFEEYILKEMHRERT